MKLHRVEHLVKRAFLSIFLAHSAAHALSETRYVNDGGYQRLEHQFVISPRGAVSAFCDSGDEFVSGACEAASEIDDSANRMESEAIRADGRAGWACRPVVVHADEDLRVTTVVKCKRHGTDEGSSADTKTPRNRGA